MDEWTPLDTGFFRHPKIVGLTGGAKLLAIAGFCYAQEHLTDGRIPTGAVRVIAVEAGTKPGVADELVAAGVWEQRGDTYWIHGWQEWNKPAEAVKVEREKKGDAGAFGNHKRWHVARGITDPSCRFCDEPANRTAIAQRSQPRIARESPPSPSPSPKELSSSSDSTRPVENHGTEDERIAAALELIAEQRTQTAWPAPKNRNRYRASVLANLRAEEALDVDAARRLDDYPKLTVSELAAVLEGSMTVLQHAERAAR